MYIELYFYNILSFKLTIIDDSLKYLANKALEGLKFSKKSQSILITGVTGAGKTVTGNHIIQFLSRANAQNFATSSAIIETFGNAKTRGNKNSSRFCKNLEVIYCYSNSQNKS